MNSILVQARKLTVNIVNYFTPSTAYHKEFIDLNGLLLRYNTTACQNAPANQVKKLFIF